MSTSQSLHIGEVARQTGLTVDAIRFYEKEQRLSFAQDIERVQFIRQVQELKSHRRWFASTTTTSKGTVQSESVIEAQPVTHADIFSAHVQEVGFCRQ